MFLILSQIVVLQVHARRFAHHGFMHKIAYMHRVWFILCMISDLQDYNNFACINSCVSPDQCVGVVCFAFLIESCNSELFAMMFYVKSYLAIDFIVQLIYCKCVKKILHCTLYDCSCQAWDVNANYGRKCIDCWLILSLCFFWELLCFVALLSGNCSLSMLRSTTNSLLCKLS